jgi:hypothetical protein
MRTHPAVDVDQIVAGYGHATPNSADIVGREFLFGDGMPADVSWFAPTTWGKHPRIPYIINEMSAFS